MLIFYVTFCLVIFFILNTWIIFLIDHCNSCLVESDYQTGSNSVFSLIHLAKCSCLRVTLYLLFVFISMQSGHQNTERKKLVTIFCTIFFINHLSLSAPEFGGPAEWGGCQGDHRDNGSSGADKESRTSTSPPTWRQEDWNLHWP